jgi:threonine synthase
MRFVSTRGQSSINSFREVVAAGLAPDGGLYLPETLPSLRPWLQSWENLSYTDLAREFLQLFASDIPPVLLKTLVDSAYSRFDHPEIAPLHRLDDQISVLELYHGPTLAFKDFALQLLGELYADQIQRSGQGIHVLGATSGDTGASAIHGLLGKPGVHIFILYPNGRISPLQELQMTTTGADNVFPLAIEGSFDDAQRVVKDVFGDLEFRHAYHLSAVNSINLARILAQSVYYLYAWLRLPKDQRTEAEFIVPTGNFGNVLAGWLLRQMGVDIAGFQVATNRNDILHRFFQTGEYRVGEVAPSVAPSMDIQVASNFERLLYFLLDRDPVAVNRTMAQLKQEGGIRVDAAKVEAIRSSSSTDADIIRTIAEIERRYGYVVDPHTACGFRDLPKGKPAVVLSTASPAKFPEVMQQALGREITHPRLEALKSMRSVKYPCVASVEEIQRFVIEHALPV